MTLVNIDLRNQGYETGPDDRVIFYSLLVREGDFGTISTAPVEVELVDGKATVDLAPGPVGVQIVARQVADTRIKIGEVPPSGPTTLGAVMMVTPAYTPALQKMMIAAIERAKEIAVGRVDGAVSTAINAEVGEFKTKAEQALTKSAAAESKSDAALSKSTTAESSAGNAVSRVSALEAMSGLSPESPVDGQTANLIAQEDTLTRGAVDLASFFSSPHVDARAYGLWDISTGTEDVADILNAAAVVAREQNRPLYIPAPKRRIAAFDGTSAYSIYKTVDLRYLDVYCEANIVVRHTDAIGIIVGDDRNRRNGRTITLGNVKHRNMGYFDWDWDFPAVRIMGLMGGYVKIPNSSFVELFADDDVLSVNDKKDGAVAYNSINLQRVNHLKLSCAGSGWVNENTFYGGSYNRITLTTSGIHAPDSNTWYKPSVEGSHVLVDVQAGAMNAIEQARIEGGARVKFGQRTSRNSFTTLYIDIPALIHDSFIIEEDLGRENVVASVAAKDHTPYTLVTASVETVATNVATGLPGLANITPGLPGGKIRLPSTYDRWIDTGLLPLESHHATREGNVVAGMTPPSRVMRFSVHCDKPAVWWYIFLYDAESKLIDSNTTTSMSMYAGWTTTSSGGYYIPNHSSGLPILLTNKDVQYIQFRANSGDASADVRLIDHASIIAYLPDGHTPSVIERMLSALKRPLYSATRPTQGLVWPGTVIQGPTGGWVSTDRRETVLVSQASATILNVEDGIGISAGDVIGVLLDDGRTHWSTVMSRVGNAVTIEAPLPSPASAGRGVGTTRWVERVSNPSTA